MPLHDVLPRARRHQASRAYAQSPGFGCRRGGGRMTTFNKIPKQIEDVLSRRNFLQGAGFLAVSLGPLTETSANAQTPSTGAAGPYPDPNFRQLDSWIVIHEDSTATFYVGK